MVVMMLSLLTISSMISCGDDEDEIATTRTTVYDTVRTEILHHDTVRTTVYDTIRKVINDTLQVVNYDTVRTHATDTLQIVNYDT